MATERRAPGDRYALGWLILDYLKAFTWPALALFIVIFGWSDLMALLRDREVNVFGVTLGQRVEGVQQRAEGELQDIAFLVGELESRLAAVENGGDAEEVTPGAPASGVEPTPEEARELTRQIETKIGSLRQNLAREVEQAQMTTPPVQQAMPQMPRPEPVGREAKLAGLERKGFEALLERDFEAALAAFTEARKTWPDYHNVTEIQRLLAGMRSDPPETDADWRQVYEPILIKYSWGMPDDIRAAMRIETGARGYSIGVRG